MQRTLIALATGGLLGLSSMAAFAQTPSTPDGTGNSQPGQVQKHRGQANPARQAFKKSLTDEQKAQFKQLREQAKADMDKILTEAQKSQLQAAIAQGKSRHDAMAALNLSAEQKAQLKQLAQARREQMKNILTPEQQQQLQQQWQNRPNHQK